MREGKDCRLRASRFASAIRGSTPTTAPNVKPHRACSIGSRVRSRSPASLRSSSVPNCSRSPTSAQSIGRSPRRSTFERPWCDVLPPRSEEHTSELQSRLHLVCRLLLEKKKNVTVHTLVHLE